MGNCSVKGTAGSCPSFIRVLTDSGRILEFKSPKVAAEILEDYPGYGLFPRGHASAPLVDHERLVRGQSYCLLPLKQEHKLSKHMEVAEWMKQIEIEPQKISSADFVENLASGSALEVLPSQGNGVWKVKLVISTTQLEEILAEQVNTEALIEKMRMAASSASRTPKRSKSSWVVGWKPILSNVFKVPIDSGK